MSSYPNHALQINLPQLRASIEYVGDQINSNNVGPTYVQSQYPVFLCDELGLHRLERKRASVFQNIAQCSSETCQTHAVVPFQAA